MESDRCYRDRRDRYRYEGTNANGVAEQSRVSIMQRRVKKKRKQKRGRGDSKYPGAWRDIYS